MLTYDELREVQKKERSTGMLSELESDFYSKVSDLLIHLKAEVGTGFTLEKVREYENALKVARDIFEVREQKILLRALRASRGKNNITGLAAEEKLLYDKLVLELASCEQSFESMLGTPKKPTMHSEEAPHPQPAPDGRKLKITNSVPQFVGIDGSKHGPFRPGELIYLPDKEGELLVKRKLAIDA